MGVIELKNKIRKQFNLIIEDESKLMMLDGVFDSMDDNLIDSPSLVPEEHYKIIDERRRKYHTGESKGSTWNKVKQELKKKHGF